MDDLIRRQAVADWLQKWNGYLDNDMIARMQYRVVDIPSERQWIPVTERLPEYGIDVLTVDGYGEYELNHIIDEEDGEWYWEKPIAWMPLPKPWKGEKDDE